MAPIESPRTFSKPICSLSSSDKCDRRAWQHSLRSRSCRYQIGAGGVAPRARTHDPTINPSRARPSLPPALPYRQAAWRLRTRDSAGTRLGTCPGFSGGLFWLRTTRPSWAPSRVARWSSNSLPALGYYNDYPDHPLEHGPISSNTWTVADARARLSEVINWRNLAGRRLLHETAAQQPWLSVPRNGNGKPNVPAEFFAASPLRGSRLKAGNRGK